MFLAPRHRRGQVKVACDGTSSLGHVVESLGVPLPEVGGLIVNGRPAAPGYRPGGGDVADVGAVRRPQRLVSARFVLDVHLGTLARRLRLAGVDAAYANDRDDDALIGRPDRAGERRAAGAANPGSRVAAPQEAVARRLCAGHAPGRAVR